MQLNPLTAISPLDGRYRGKLEDVAEYFSEHALIKARVQVEMEWFVFLCNAAKLAGTRVLSAKEIQILRSFYNDFAVADSERVKAFEDKTNHDVKAVEYYIKEHLRAYPKLDALREFVHFACTSEDINNLACGLMLKNFYSCLYMPIATGVVEALYERAIKYKNTSMLARTHGQPASPTTMGKEFIVFVARLEQELVLMKTLPIYGKFNGATGNFNAHTAAYPNVNWLALSKQFVTSFGFSWNAYTTQIEPHDHLAALFHSHVRLNTVAVDLCKDVWSYISFGYFKQKLKAGETGSSTMPHKVNPIDFENAEGNFGLANALFGYLAEKLPVSRMQRDLTDSTVMRNIGTAFGHTVLAFKSLLQGLSKLEINNEIIEKDLDNNWEILAEAVQTVLRRHKVESAYEKLKALTRGKHIGKQEFQKFIQELKIPSVDKNRLFKMTPGAYTGLARKLVDAYKPLFRK